MACACPVTGGVGSPDAVFFLAHAGYTPARACTLVCAASVVATPPRTVRAVNPGTPS